MNTTTRTVISHFTAPAADISGILIYLLIGPLLLDRFVQTEVDPGMLVNLTIMAVFYVVFLASVNAFKRLPEQGSAEKPFAFVENRKVGVGAAIIFAMVMIFVLLDLSGFMDSVFRLDFGDSGNSLYLLLGPSVMVVFALLYIFVVITPPHPEVAPVSNPQRVALLTLLGANLIISALSSYLASLLLRTGSSTNVFVTTVFVLILFALLFIFPRLLYIRKTGTVTSLWSLLIALGIYAAATALASQP